MILKRKRPWRMALSLTAITLLLNPLPIRNADAEPLTGYVDDFFYKLGGGRTLPRAASGYVTYKIGARLQFTPGYSCGKFSMEDNLEEALNRIRDQINGLPDQLGMAATSAISALPLYLVKNYAPDIYGLLVWNLDQSIELFRFEYKTCETLEAEIHNNDAEYNPFKTAVRASVLNQWHTGADNGDTIDETSRKIQNSPGDEGITFLSPGRGKAGNPIPLRSELVILAYNVRIGRGNTPLDVSAPVGQSGTPLVQVWPTPQAAADWVIAATGEFWLTVEDSAQKETSNGVGLRPEIDKLTDDYQNAINNAVQLRDHDALDGLEKNVPPKLRISDRLVESIRLLPELDQTVSIERLASETALSIVKNKVDLALALLRASVQDPDVLGSDISQICAQVSLDARTWLREEMVDIEQSMYFDASGMRSTPTLIMGHSNSVSTRKSFKAPRTFKSGTEIGADGAAVPRP